MADTVHVIAVLVKASVSALNIRQSVLQIGFQCGKIRLRLDNVRVFGRVGRAQGGAYGSLHHHGAGGKRGTHHNKQGRPKANDHQAALVLFCDV